MKELHEMYYAELSERVEETIQAIRRRGYEEGYQHGKADAKLREISETILTPEKLAKLDQKKRDEIVAKAKADVGKLSRNGFSFNSVGDKRLVKYIVNKDKRTVVALLSGYLSGIIYERGIAKCDPSDCFNVHIGKAIALRRALGLDLPSYYLNVPNPTEVRVGNGVKFRRTDGKEVTRIVRNVTDERYFFTTDSHIYKNAKEIHGGHATDAEVIDDSRE